MSESYTSLYNPDVLSTLANLSSDEVFTPPHIVNQMLDMIPQELFKDKNAKFLDPATKSGVFLREIAKRLLVGLEDQIPELQERIDHIFQTQLFGIAITEMTSLLSRRSLYCSKYPNSKYSISLFDTVDGNIRYKKAKHHWSGEKCIVCGANKKIYDRASSLETHAYEFIHNKNIKEYEDMKFDVIIGNPPYHLDDGGAQASAAPIYHLFIEQSIKLKPKYLSMIVPSRWFSGGKNLGNFRKTMLSKHNFKYIHDFPNASECFPGVEIKGGVNYFLWERDYDGECEVSTHENGSVTSTLKRPLLENGLDVFIRNNELVSVYKKVAIKKEYSFSVLVSAAKAYGLRNDFFKDESKYDLPKLSESPIHNGLRIFGLDRKMQRTIKYAPNNYPLPRTGALKEYKFFVTESYGSGAFGEIPSNEILAGPYDVCTETFLEIGPFKNTDERDNCVAYWKTKFFRALVGIKKITQHCTQNCYSIVPIQDFSKRWTDKELYEKYNLSQDEINFIENNVKEIL